jgi:hypothetical protein
MTVSLAYSSFIKAPHDYFDDTSFANWAAPLISKRKERLLISGIGTEFVCKTY